MYNAHLKHIISKAFFPVVLSNQVETGPILMKAHQ